MFHRPQRQFVYFMRNCRSLFHIHWASRQKLETLNNHQHQHHRREKMYVVCWMHLIFDTIISFLSFNNLQRMNQPWVMRCQVVFIHQQALCCCTVCEYLLCLSDSDFDLALRRVAAPCTAVGPHPGRSNRVSTPGKRIDFRLLSACCNWLVVPYTFPDVGIQFHRHVHNLSDARQSKVR